MPVPRSLMREYVTLCFNDVVGLTYYHDAGDSLGRTRMVLRLKKGVERWCEDTIGYTPWLQAYLNRKKKSVYLRFKDEQDRMLFQLRFAHHFMPAAIHFIPFGDELDD